MIPTALELTCLIVDVIMIAEWELRTNSSSRNSALDKIRAALVLGIGQETVDSLKEERAKAAKAKAIQEKIDELKSQLASMEKELGEAAKEANSLSPSSSPAVLVSAHEVQ